jgi:hypothetical protein
MATLLSSYAVDKPAISAMVNGRIYLTNDKERVKVWDGLSSAIRDSGMAAPAAVIGAATHAAGNVDVGAHLVRYRYIDANSPGGAYRSNPSTASTETVATSAKKLTFSVGTAGNDIVRSTDPKCTHIQLEATAVDGSTYYVVTTIANAGVTTVDYDISDTVLTAGDATATYDDFGHEQPPLGAIIAECRNYVFIGGAHLRTSTFSLTNASAAFTCTPAISPQWTGRLVRFAAEALNYEILTVASDGLSGTLTAVYAGSTAAYTGTVYPKNPNRLYWSKAGFPESFKGASRVKDVLSGRGDRLVGIADYEGDLFLFGLRSAQRLVFVDDPLTGELDTVAGEFGIWNQRCLFAMDGAMYGWGANGVWMMTGGRPRWLSRPIDTTVAALMLPAYSDLFHATYDPAAKVLRWHFVGTGDTTPQYAMAYDLAGQRWMLDQWRQAIDAGVTVSDDQGRLRLVLADSANGRSWYAEGDTDGVPAASTGAYTANTGSTTTVTQVTDSLPTGAGTDLSGTILYRPATGEERVIASNTSSAITTAALASAVSVGEAIYVGAIPWTFTTPWWVGQGQQNKSRPAYLHLTLVPATTGSVRVSIYKDYSASPVTFTGTSDDRWPDGVTLVTGATYVTVDLDAGNTDGFVAIPMPSDWARAWRAVVTCLSPAGDLRVLDCQFSVESSRESVQDTTE